MIRGIFQSLNPAPIGTMKWTVIGLAILAACIVVAPIAADAAPKQRSPAPADRRITDVIEEEILLDGSVQLNDVGVSTAEGVVTLTGKTSTLLARERAADIAKTVRGVRAVINQMIVAPHWNRPDWEVARDITQALYFNPATEVSDIRVSVNNGAVVLTGKVDSWQEKSLSADVVKGVKGVKEIKNNIEVERKGKRSDPDIQKDAEAVLRWDMLVDDELIRVSSKDGRVTLRGVVGSLAEKSRAIMDAYVSGVWSVDASELKVTYWTRENKLRKSKYLPKSDAAIAAAVTDAFIRDPRVDAADLEARVENGVVTLRGTVDNLRSKRVAAQDAANTVGVRSVRNHARVAVKEALSDEALKQRLKKIFDWDPYVDRNGLEVDVINGTVDLSGEVDGYFEKARADDLAAAMSGVKAVRNNLEIRDRFEHAAYNPYIQEIDPRTYEWYGPILGKTYRSDRELRERIENELWWSPFVDDSAVKVTVNDGIATLFGEVETRRERREAMEEAFEGGAIWVRNRIEIE